MKKNNLDDLFKRKLGDFQEVPDNSVWERIATSLDKKRKKRVLPIWWQLGGAAALLAILLYLVDPFAIETETTLPVVGTEQPDTTPEVEENSTPNKQILDATDTNADSQLVDTQTTENDVIRNDQSSTATSSKKDGALKATDGTTTSLANATTEKQDAQNENLVKDPVSLQEQQEVAIAVAREDKVLPENARNTENNDVLESEKETVAQNEKKSIYDAIEEQKEAEKDLVAIAEPKNRWSMGAALAPVYFNSLGEGSPIHSNFAPNSKSGKVNLSYGLTVTYNVNKKLSIRSGVHKVDFGYDTNDIVFSSSLTASTNDLIDNIDYAQTSRNLVVEPKSNSVAAFRDNVEVTAGEIAPLEGRMVQQLGYIEVPMELNYAIVDKKLGVHLIGGVSSLFLVDNAVTLESEDLVTEMGEANNVNSLNFSTNIGVGFNYEIAPKLRLNLEPMFKYQLNTFSDAAGNFRPYSIGVYSGLNFRF